ncbi:VOC family protein [Listeria ilorinensis]|uniref:VOC family protein n=1 Tax=Listeria ilorinensis TaxID=2867439 RepID=UPI001EF73CD2|nr:VOC family protein [Listeria ilorinensis]
MRIHMHHVSALIKEFERTDHFYAKVLGYRLVKNTVNQANVKMRHLFYGDYEGTPGTILTYFEVPHIGNHYHEKAYFGTIQLGIPVGSLTVWRDRLEHYGIAFSVQEDGLHITDPDGMKLALIEINEQIAPEKATRHTDIPADKQIVRIIGAVYHVPDLEAERTFFHKRFGFTQEGESLTDTAGRSKMTFIQTTSSKKTRFGKGTIDHIAYGVETAREVDALYRRAIENGLEIEEYVDRGYFKSLYIRDPAGLRIEFASDEPGFTLDEPIQKLGMRLSLPPFLEERRQEIETYFGGENHDERIKRNPPRNSNDK